MQANETKIIQKYNKIFTFFFHYLIFFVAIIVALIIFQTKLSRSASITIFQWNDNFSLQQTKLIAEFNKFMKQNIQENDMDIHILQWDLEIDQWFIKSVNNLINYKWFVLPKYFYVYGTIPVKQIEYFAWSGYDISELENFVNTFIFTKKFTIAKPFTRVHLPLTESITDTFNLSCIFENKIYSRTCNYYLNEFLESFFVYNISQEYTSLTDIFNTIKKNATNKKTFCEWLSKYLLYANDYSQTIKELFSSCWPEYEELFTRTSFFMEIQSDLDNQAFNQTTYKDDVLNTYKLLSYQQQIYQDFLVNKADAYKISMYLDFVRELLRKDIVAPFYKDVIYRYNNKYLATALENITYQSSVFTQNLGSSRIASLITSIKTINEGEPMLGFSGLTNEIQNQALIIQEDIYTWTITTNNIAERIDTRLENLSYLTIEKKSTSEDIVDIVWYLKFSSPEKTENIKTHIIIDYHNDMLLVKSIELQDKAGINEALKNLLLIQQFSLGELYSYISKNLIFYEQENALITASNDLCPNLSSLTNSTIVSCTNSSIIIEKNNITYTFTLQNGWLEQVVISDKELENYIKASYSAVVKNSYILLDTIKAILAYEAPVKIREGSTDAILVFENIQQFLWIKPNDIASKDGKILVDISIWWINFIAQYTLGTNTMWPRYFKDILNNNSPYMIKNLNLLLDDTNQNRIHTFVIDPLEVIKTSDLTAWQNYQEYAKKN